MREKKKHYVNLFLFKNHLPVIPNLHFEKHKPAGKAMQHTTQAAIFYLLEHCGFKGSDEMCSSSLRKG